MPRADASRRRCAIYARKSSEEGLEQEFNSLAAQREACEAFIRSQQHEGWVLAKTRYDDGGFSGGNVERPALQDLLGDIRAGRIDIVVVYKVDRLTRSLADFARLVELFSLTGIDAVPPPESSDRLQTTRGRGGAAAWGISIRSCGLACEQVVLLRPVQRQIEFGQPRRSERDGLPALQDRLDQLRAQEGEANEPANVAPGNAVTLG